MNLEIALGLERTFQVHSLVASLFGLQHLLVPRWWTNLAGMEIEETVTWRVLGAALLGFAVSSWLTRKESDRNKVRAIVAMEIVWSALGAAVIVWGILFEGLPALEWLNAVLLGLFAIVFAVFFLVAERRHTRAA